jgi:Poly (ADP-ribose) glycohydrolase (PARG)
MRSEPALFAKCPEALVGLLVFEKIAPNEAVLINGARILAKHEGYAEELKFGGKLDDMSVFGGLLIVDALDFRKPDSPVQWSQEGIEREITKLYAGMQNKAVFHTLFLTSTPYS